MTATLDKDFAEEQCDKGKDGIHCECWYDCYPCCWCGNDTGGEEDCDCDRHTAMRVRKENG